MIERTGALSGTPAKTRTGPDLEPKKGIDPLEKACRQFEGIFLAALLKQSRQGSLTEDKRPFGALEETSLEMAAESISGSGEGLGLWKVLYENLSEGRKGAGNRE